MNSTILHNLEISKPKTERNKALYEDYKKGTPRIEMIIKYKISHTRILQIINRMKELENK